MNRLLSLACAALAVSLLASPVSATPLVDSSCSGAGNCTTDNSTNQTVTNANANANSATGGNATGGSAVNAPVTVNTNTAKIERGAVDNDIDVKNHVDVDTNIRNSNHQKQQQQQQQQQKASSHSYSESEVKNSGNSDVDINYQRNTAQAYSPALVASSETCVQSQSAGAQGPAFGISLGFSHTNEGCEMRRNAGMLFALGNRGAAVELLCSDDDIRDAMKAAGTPCRADQQTTPQAQLQDGAEAAKVAAFEPMQPVQ